MPIVSIIKGAAILCFSLAVAGDSHAQIREWFQQSPQQHYYPGSTFSTGRYTYPYQYQYQQRQRQPAGSTAKKKTQTSKEAKATASTAKKKAEQVTRWYTSYNSAVQKSKETGRPLVAIFVHKGCPECDRMDATLSQQAAIQTLDSAIKLRLEFSENTELAQRWGVSLTPTFIVLSPGNGGEVYREVGALSVDRLRTLQPSIEGLVTQPQPPKKNAKESTAAAPKTDKTPTETTPADDASSRTVAAL